MLASRPGFSDEKKYGGYKKYVDVISSLYDVYNNRLTSYGGYKFNAYDTYSTIERIVDKCYLSIGKDKINKIKKKCIIIQTYDNIIPLDHFQAIYGRTVFNNPIDAVLNQLINSAKEYELEGRGWWIKDIFD